MAKGETSSTNIAFNLDNLLFGQAAWMAATDALEAALDGEVTNVNSTYNRQILLAIADDLNSVVLPSVTDEPAKVLLGQIDQLLRNKQENGF